MEAIKLFGKNSCHKSRFYQEWLRHQNIPFDFYELENNTMNTEFLTMFYAEGKAHFPTIVVGNRTLRNPSLSKISKQLVLEGVEQLEDGFSEVLHRGQRYTVNKTIFNDGKSTKVYAENVANGDFISFNLYITKAGLQLKPCEIPEEKVLSFLNEYEHTNARLFASA